MYFECVWLLYRRFFDCFSVICNKTFYKVYTLFSHTHLTTLSRGLVICELRTANWRTGNMRTRPLIGRARMITATHSRCYLPCACTEHITVLYEKLINYAKKKQSVSKFSCILLSETNTNNKNLHQIGVTNYLSSTVNTNLDLEMTIIILRRHCL